MSTTESLEQTFEPIKKLDYNVSGYKGVSIKLPALEQYVSELVEPKPASDVTGYLAEKLYKVQEPHKVRFCR